MNWCCPADQHQRERSFGGSAAGRALMVGARMKIRRVVDGLMTSSDLFDFGQAGMQDSVARASWADCSGQWIGQIGAFIFSGNRVECRVDTGGAPRIVRIGTHALIKEPGTRLWTRLRQHKGAAGTGGWHPQRINLQTHRWCRAYLPSQL